MSKITSREYEIYREFFTSSAVAWFSAGVIGPLFSPSLGTKEYIAATISIVASLAFLRFAAIFIRKERK